MKKCFRFEHMMAKETTDRVTSKSGNMMHELHLFSYLSPKLESTSSLYCLLLDKYKILFFHVA